MSKLVEAVAEFLSRNTSNKPFTKEEVEPIDELSKSTLASYAKKASADAVTKSRVGKDLERVARSARKPEYKLNAWKWEDKFKSDARKREAGVNKAIDRLAKEEVEQVNELMKFTRVISEKISPYDWDGHRQSMNHHNEYAETGSKPHLKDKHKEAAKAHKAAADAIEKNSPNAEELSKKAKSMSKELAKNYSYSHDDRYN